MDIKKRVNQIVRKYGTRNPLEIVEKMDMILVRYPLEGVRGFYHELGHVFLHKNSNAIFMDTRTHFVKNKYENEANLFAMNLLISDEDIEEHLEYTTSQLSRLFGYEKSLIELRLKNFN